VWGTIWLDLEGRSFPEAGWSDMVLAVLRGWLANVDNLVTKDIDQERLFFMDGPFEIRILKEDSDLWKLILFKRESEILFESKVISSQDVVEAVLDASIRAIQVCKEKGIKSRDLDLLVELVERENGGD
jgi:hypothetical protein